MRSYQYRDVRTNTLVNFSSRDELPLDISFLGYTEDGWARFRSVFESRDIDICYSAIINLLPKFSKDHRQIRLHYGSKVFSLSVINPKKYLQVLSQETVYRKSNSNLEISEAEWDNREDLRNEDDKITELKGTEVNETENEVIITSPPPEYPINRADNSIDWEETWPIIN